MTKLGGLGCTLIGLGPCLTLFVLTIAHSPLKVIILTASGFFWVLSLLLTSVFWFAFKSVVGHLAPSLVVGVIVQEAMRFAFFKLIMKADDGLRLISTNAQNSRLETVLRNAQSGDTTLYHRVPTVDRPPSESPNDSFRLERCVRPDLEDSGRLLNHRIVAYVAGLGYGLMSCIVELLRLLIDSYGPGIGTSYWESKTFYVIAAFEMMCISVTHIFWSMVLFTAFDQRKWVYLPLVYFTHLAVSLVSLLNQKSSPWPELVCTTYVITLLLMALLAYFALRAERRPKTLNEPCLSDSHRTLSPG